MQTKQNELTIDSPIDLLISHFRRIFTIRKELFFLNGLEKEGSLLKHLTSDYIAAFHVFDFGHLLDNDHVDFFDHDDLKSVLDMEGKTSSNVPLFLPHQRTLLVTRHSNIVYVYAAEQTRDGISFTVFYYPFPTKQWTWIGQTVILSKDNRLKYVTADSMPEDMKRDVFLQDPLMFCKILTLKGEMIEVEPVKWYYATEPDKKPKAFQTPNPFVSVVRVNTARIRRPPTGAGPTGVKQRGSNVRSHERRYGNRVIIIPEHKRNGGAPQPAMKVVKI